MLESASKGMSINKAGKMRTSVWIPEPLAPLKAFVPPVTVISEVTV
jgi:hypothetical protein